MADYLIANATLDEYDRKTNRHRTFHVVIFSFTYRLHGNIRFVPVEVAPFLTTHFGNVNGGYTHCTTQIAFCQRTMLCGEREVN